MSDIELVIKIPEDMYKVISEDEYGIHQGRIYEIIRNGTPLDEIRKRIELEKLGYPPSAGYYKAIVKVLQIIDKCESGRWIDMPVANCNCMDEEIAKSFIEDVEKVKDLLPGAESEDQNG